ncbi:MAG: hypothetical protein Q4B58_04930 [Bacteroidales bacterium]|nr:hypothetical protein [Bacteroidales bacterium]
MKNKKQFKQFLSLLLVSCLGSATLNAQEMNKETQALYNRIISEYTWEAPVFQMDTAKIMQLSEEIIHYYDAHHIFHGMYSENDFRDAGNKVKSYFKERIYGYWLEEKKKIEEQYPEMLKLKKKQQYAISYSMNKLYEKQFQNSYKKTVDVAVDAALSYLKENGCDFNAYLEKQKKNKERVEALRQNSQGQSDAEIIDLGLSVKWASYNVDASAPEHSGNYYAWGSITNLVGEKSPECYGLVSYEIGGTPKDVAYVKWGGSWRMPTNKEFEELLQCRREWVVQKGVPGIKFTGRNGNQMFMPAAGRAIDVIEERGKVGHYWCSNGSGTGIHDFAISQDFNQKVIFFGNTTNKQSSSYRQTIRPVYCNIADVSGEENGVEYVDLGLSVMWGTCNLGADYPELFGDLYSWGETSCKWGYTLANYKYIKDKKMTKYVLFEKNGDVDKKTKLDPEDDTASQKLGGSWRMPTVREISELVEKCRWKKCRMHSILGWQVIGPNGNSIFLPMGEKQECLYWSSSLNYESIEAYSLYLNKEEPQLSLTVRFKGVAIRPVCKPMK